jgi:ABC-type cobalt transport system substrate-binding protein
MDNNKIEKYAAIFLLTFLLILFLVISFLSEGYYGGADNINHYFIARYSFQNPALFFDGWGRPLYTILSSPFAQFGFYGIKLFNVILAILTMLFVYLTAKKSGYSPALLAIVMIGFSPIYFITIFSALTEILAGFVLILSVYLFMREKYITSAIVLSFIYFARAETMIFYPIFLVAFLFKKRFRAIPFLFIGILFFTIIGGFFFKDFLWLIHRFPYPVHSTIYKEKGPLLYFLDCRKLILGVPMEILFVLGMIILFFQQISKNKLVRKKAFNELIVIFIPFAGFFAMHSVLYWKALGGSVGYLRVIASVIPLSAIICIKGYSFVDVRLKLFPWLRYLVMAGVSGWIIQVNFKTYEFPFKVDDDEKVIKITAEWIKNSEYANRKILYADLRIPYYMDINPFERKQLFQMYNPRSLGFVPDGSIIVWDSHFGPNENGVPHDSLFLNKHFKLLKVFEPLKEITTLGGKKYEVLVFLKLSAGKTADNSEFLKGMKEKEERSYKLVNSYVNDFETPRPGIIDSKLNTEFAHSGKQSYMMDGASLYSPGFDINCNNFKPGQGGIKVRISVYLFSQVAIDSDRPSLVISLEDDKKSYDYNTIRLTSLKLVVNQWNHIEKEVKLLLVHSPTDHIKIYIYNPEKNVFFIDDFKADVLEFYGK